MMKSENDLINVVYFSRFVKSEKGHGGIRRASQILKALDKYHPQFISAPEKDYIDEPLNIPEIKFRDLSRDDVEFKNIVTDKEYFCWSENFRNILFHYRMYAHKWSEVISTKLLADIAFVDEPFFFAPLIDRLNELNIPIVGLEQNIETLVRGQVDDKYQYVLFQKEIGYFKKCNLVITISHEDTVTLNNFGVKTLLFPYYPISDEKEIFLKIREDRSASEDKKDFIMLGTAHNIPTFEGMIELAKIWATEKKLKNETLYIVGYGTEKVKDILGSAVTNNIKILGGVDDDTLQDLLKKVKASILYQNSGTGTLTKITELLIAGVPVYANHHAARSFHNVQGVEEYNDFLHLINNLTETVPKKMKIELPVPAPPQTDYLLQSVDKIISEGFNKRKLNDYRTIIQNQSKRIVELETELRGRTEQSSQQAEDKLLLKEQQIQYKNEQLSQKDKWLQEQKEQLSQKEKQLQQEKQLNNKMKEQLHHKEQQLQELKSQKDRQF